MNDEPLMERERHATVDTRRLVVWQLTGWMGTAHARATGGRTTQRSPPTQITLSSRLSHSSAHCPYLTSDTSAPLLFLVFFSLSLHFHLSPNW
jgi:hypothetical protein